MPTSILIVDDDVGVGLMLSSVLHDEGYAVETVKSGAEAVKACKASFFDVALIDIELPDVKGTDLLKKLKKLRPGMIKIIITGYPSVESAVKAVNEKADGYVLKPFEVTDLLEQIMKIMTDNTNMYLRISSEATLARESTSIANYEDPQKLYISGKARF